jgi:hypothetical protein
MQEAHLEESEGQPGLDEVALPTIHGSGHKPENAAVAPRVPSA